MAGEAVEAPATVLPSAACAERVNPQSERTPRTVVTIAARVARDAVFNGRALDGRGLGPATAVSSTGAYLDTSMGGWYQPAQVLNNKNCKRTRLITWGGIVILCSLLGCTPPGPKALLEGRRLLEQGKAEEAIPRLLQATDLMITNALAWSSLGVAYHQSGRHEQAFKAYQTALKLDYTMSALRFNLGCLYLDMNNVGAAVDELRTFTLLQPNSVEGWLKLGTAQYRARRLDDAEKSFKHVLGLQARQPEAWNGQGLVQFQRRRWTEAIAAFTSALASDTNYAPALLNAAVVQHQYLNNRSLALQHYRRYVELIPDAGDEVRGTIAQLERELNVAPVPPAGTAQRPNSIAANSTGASSNNAATRNAPSNPPAPASGILTELKPKPANPAPVTSSGSGGPMTPVSPGTASARPSRPLELVPIPSAATASGAGSGRPTNVPRVVESAKPAPVPAAPSGTGVGVGVGTLARPGTVAATDLEVGHVRNGLVVKPPGPEPGATGSGAATAADAAPSAENTPPPLKRGFFARLNPFGRGRASNEVDSASGGQSTTNRDLLRPEGLPELAPVVTRYVYVSPKRPADGNREAALAEFKKGVKAQKAGDRAAAAASYQTAFRADPGFFDAYYNLGLLALDSGDARLSLWAYEFALAIQPDSADARYNLSLALKAGGYPLDAADQLQILLQQNSGDARAHLSLANLFAQQLKQPRRAREHYLRVLELNPKHPDAATIRYWLAANP